MIQKAPIEIVCQASRSITAHASPAHALSADNSDSPLLNLRLSAECVLGEERFITDPGKTPLSQLLFEQRNGL